MAEGLLATPTDEQVSCVHERESGYRVRRAQRPHAARLRRMVDANFDFIWRSLRRFGLSEADAEDGAQEVFVVAARRIDDIAAERERAFLIGTALRVASVHRRKAVNRYERCTGDGMAHRDPAPNPEEALHRRRSRQRLDEVLDELSLELRAVFVLFELEELTAPEIAQLLGIPVGTVASRLRRARQAFSEAVKRCRARDSFRRGSS